MGFPLRFPAEHWLCLGNHSCAQTCKHKWGEHDELGTNFFQDREKPKQMLEEQTKLKPNPQLYPEAWGWFSWEHPWGVKYQGAWSRGALGTLCPWDRFCSSGLSSLTSPGFSVWCNFQGAVADNLQEVGLDDSIITYSFILHMTGKHPTKSLSQSCRELVHLLLIMEMAVLIKLPSFGPWSCLLSVARSYLHFL